MNERERAIRNFQWWQAVHSEISESVTCCLDCEGDTVARSYYHSLKQMMEAIEDLKRLNIPWSEVYEEEES